MMRIKARDLMTPKVLCVSDDMTIAELATFLIEEAITGAVVIDGENKMVGVVSMTDITSHVKERAEITTDFGRSDFYLHGWEESSDKIEMLEFHLEDTQLCVRDILTPEVYSIEADAEISQVAEEMLRGRIHRILVLEEGGVVGIISTSDFLELFVSGRGAARRASSGEMAESIEVRGVDAESPESGKMSVAA